MYKIRERMSQKGLTLIELLVTIAVIAVVAAISIPVITNVISSAETNSAASMNAQVDSFLDKYTQAGNVEFDGTDTFTAWVDLNGDGTFDDPAEVIETFTVDTTQFTVTVDDNAAPTSGGTSVAAASGGAAQQAAPTANFADGATLVSGISALSQAPAYMSSWTPVTSAGGTLSQTWDSTHSYLILVLNRSNGTNPYFYFYTDTAGAQAIASTPVYDDGTNYIQDGNLFGVSQQYVAVHEFDSAYGSSAYMINGWAGNLIAKVDSDVMAGATSTNVYELTDLTF